MHRSIVIILVSVLTVFGEEMSNAQFSKSGNSTLADTQWRLLEFQSMDNTDGIKRTDDPSKYTMQLKKDGTVSMKLNCNFAKGTCIIVLKPYFQQETICRGEKDAS